MAYLGIRSQVTPFPRVTDSRTTAVTRTTLAATARITMGLRIGATIPAAPDRSAQEAILLNATMRPGYSVTNVDDAIPYRHAHSRETAIGSPYGQITSEVKTELAADKEFQAVHIIIEVASAQLSAYRSGRSATPPLGIGRRHRHCDGSGARGHIKPAHASRDGAGDGRRCGVGVLYAAPAGADNKRLNKSVAADVYTIQHQGGCSNDVHVNPQLQLAAQWHTDDVLNNRGLDDIGSDGSTTQERADAAGYQGTVSETVAINSALAISGVEIMNDWYYRPDYMAIMSNCANSQIGVWSDNSLDRTVVVAVYGEPVAP